jgi:hypothetical protein
VLLVRREAYSVGMITPKPTTKIDEKLARGVLADVGESDGQKTVTIAFPDTSYEIRLVSEGDVSTPVGKRIVGTINVRARRIDAVDAGGRFVEPIYGRPRRVQGRVIAVDGDAIVVDAGVIVHATPTDGRQSATDFEPGQLVSFDVLKGASFIESI